MQRSADIQTREGEASAGVALMKLDIASARSSLAQLQRACAAASEEHARNKTELLSIQQQHLEPNGEAYALDSLKTSLGSRTAGKQLQALHTENLHLKACLKQEVEARQELEKKHSALLELLRSGRVLELLASGYIPLSAHAEAALARQHGDWSSQADLHNMPAADAAFQPDQAAASRAAASASDASISTSGVLRQPERTISSSSYTSSQADGDGCSPNWRRAATTAVAPDSTTTIHLHRRHGTAGVPANSAYFPAEASKQEQQPHQQALHQVQDEQQTAFASRLRVSTQSGPSPSPTPVAPGTWQESLHQGLFCKRAQHGSTAQAPASTHPPAAEPLSPLPGNMQQWMGVGSASTPQRQQQPQHEEFLQPTSVQQPQHPPVYLSTLGFEVEEGLLSNSTSSHSAPSELLDSDDLDELAGLCDSLLQQHATPSPLGHTSMKYRPDGVNHAEEQQSSQWHRLPGQQQPQMTGTAQASGLTRDQLPGHQQHHHQDSASALGCQQEGDNQASVPGLQALAAQLRQLQEQVAATVMDAVPVRNGNGNKAEAPSSTPSRQTKAGTGYCAADPHPAQHSSKFEHLRGSSSSSGGSGWWQAHQAAPIQSMACDGPGMTSLQQQLAHRMQEVKERLSNICNGMLAEPTQPAAAVVPPSSNSSTQPKATSSFFSPPASPAEQQLPSAQPWRQHTSTARSKGSGHGAGLNKGAEGSAAGKLGPRTGTEGGAQAAGGHDSLFKAAGSRKAHNSSRASSSTSHSSAAAFAAIKASINATAHVPGAAPRAQLAADAAACAEAAGSTVRPQAGAHQRTFAHASKAASRAAAPQPAAGNMAGASSSGSQSSIPAAFQGSWVSADDTAATDSEGSWATVDELEQEQLQQQQGMSSAKAAVRAEQQSPRHVNSGSSSSSAQQEGSPGRGDTQNPVGIAGGLGTLLASGSPPGTWQHGQQEHQLEGGIEQLAAHAGLNCPHMAMPPTTQRPVQDPEQPASPVSCESSMLASNLTARMPAEVVFSPMKAPSGAAGASKGPSAAAATAADTISPLRQRNV